MEHRNENYHNWHIGKPKAEKISHIDMINKRVMVVDDDELIIEMLSTILSKMGFDITTANDPFDA